MHSKLLELYDCDVVTNPGLPSSLYGTTTNMSGDTVYVNRETREKVSYPRLGAFEVTLENNGKVSAAAAAACYIVDGLLQQGRAHVSCRAGHFLKAWDWQVAQRGGPGLPCTKGSGRLPREQ